MSKRLTNEIVDERLSNRSIKRIGNYIDGKTKIDFTCLICKNNWTASPNNILNKHFMRGCPSCGGSSRLTNDIVDKRLAGRSIKRIGNYVNNRQKVKWKCLIKSCAYIWFASASQILYNNVNCPKCAKIISPTNSYIDSYFQENNIPIKRLEDVVASSKKIKWQCLIDNHVWITTPSAILNNKTGCPKCSNNAKFSNAIIDEKLWERNIKRMDDYFSANKKIRFQCKNCSCIWRTTTASVINAETDCPACGNSNEKRILFVLKKNNIDFEYQKSIKHLGAENNYRVDFYLPKYKLAIEYNGIQHYKPTRFGGISHYQAQINFETQKARDAYVRNFCKLNNIKLIEIDGRKLVKTALEKYIINTIRLLTIDI